jgi:hypothetical protein
MVYDELILKIVEDIKQLNLSYRMTKQSELEEEKKIDI